MKLCSVIRVGSAPSTLAMPTRELAATSEVMPELRNTVVEKNTTALMPENC